MEYIIYGLYYIKKLRYIILLMILIGIVVLLDKAVKAIKRRRFSKRYGIDKLPKSITITRGNKKEQNYYKLKYPYWKNSKKDGTADLRVKENKIIWPVSFLYINGLKLKSKFPYDLLYVVKELREKNITIKLCKEEKIKYTELKNKMDRLSKNVTIQSIVSEYENNASGFERLCAELFEKMGYQAKVTPQSNDGGYDIVLLRNNEAAIVECKCYSPENKIGRPAIQKLVGANEIALANRMIFVTTSEYSTHAISYAQNVGVELIDGNMLIQYLKEYCRYGEQKTEIKESEIQLEIIDLQPYIPNDIYEEYFI